jgi:His-Xaa-Ser system protein HxsD
MGKIIINYKRDLYPKEAVMKAAYHFIGRCYLYIDQNDEDYIIQMTAKDGCSLEMIPNEFENEMLAQAVRFQVYEQTHMIRELLMARAMSSTIIEAPAKIPEISDTAESLEDILTDWFDAYET